MRRVAGYDPRRTAEVEHWPIRDGLEAFMALLRQDAERRFFATQQVWATLNAFSPKRSDPPKPPAILRDTSEGLR